jgi:hypothetical protein
MFEITVGEESSLDDTFCVWTCFQPKFPSVRSPESRLSNTAWKNKQIVRLTEQFVRFVEPYQMEAYQWKNSRARR